MNEIQTGCSISFYLVRPLWHLAENMQCLSCYGEKDSKRNSGIIGAAIAALGLKCIGLGSRAAPGWHPQHYCVGAALTRRPCDHGSCWTLHKGVPWAPLPGVGGTQLSRRQASEPKVITPKPSRVFTDSVWQCTLIGPEEFCLPVVCLLELHWPPGMYRLLESDNLFYRFPARKEFYLRKNLKCCLIHIWLRWHSMRLLA